MSAEEHLTPAQQRWRSHLERMEEEGLSIRAYAQREGISEQSLYTFRRKLKQRSNPSAAPVGFATFNVSGLRDAGRGSCVLEWANGVRLHCEGWPDPAWLIAVMEQAPRRLVSTRA